MNARVVFPASRTASCYQCILSVYHSFREAVWETHLNLGPVSYSETTRAHIKK